MAKKKSTRKKVSRKKPAPEPIEAIEHPIPIPMDRILDQKRPIAQLEAAMQSDRLHHAWIFHGPKGVGKFTTALAFAALALDDTTAPDLSGRLTCDPQSRVQALLRTGSHPDLHIITKELARFSDKANIRSAKLVTIPKDVIETHLLHPSTLAAKVSVDSMASKVFIIDEAELLDRSAGNAAVQNAMLKTLEEPPPGTLIILVTSSEERLLPTIRSRCQRVRFSPLCDRAMEDWLAQTSYDPDTIEWAKRFGVGSPGFVTEAIETGFISWYAPVEEMLNRLLSGDFPLEMGSELASMVDSWASARVEADKRASKEAANQAGADRMLSIIADLLRDRLNRVAMHGDAVELDRIGVQIDTVGLARSRIRSHVPMAMVFEALAAELDRSSQPSMLSGE
ncbi:MAG TPA: AAA family ATPase [Phycisphaerales bacterium]|nr:AAA family ATPase [Phycisphaerales bacterium]